MAASRDIRLLSCPGDVLMYRVTSRSKWKARAIAIVQIIRKEWNTDHLYSHASIVAWDRMHQLEAVMPKCRVSEIKWDTDGLELWRAVDINGINVDMVVRAAHAMVGKWYDFPHLLGGLIDMKNAEICTTFVVKAFEKGGILLAENAGKFVAPNELLGDGRLKRIV